MSTGKQAASPIVTACPQCGAGLLNAIVRLSLFGVSLEDGLVVDYDGGPQPESEADIIELCAEDNTIIFCDAGHIIGNVSGAQPDPLQILEHQQQRIFQRDRLQRLADLAQHAVPGRPQYLPLQCLAMLVREECGKLHQPGWRLRR